MIYTFSIEISTGSEINEDLHDGGGKSLGNPVGGLKVGCDGIMGYETQK